MEVPVRFAENRQTVFVEVIKNDFEKNILSVGQIALSTLLYHDFGLTN